jgi:hypothetical protein
MIFTKLDKFKKYLTPRVAVGVALPTPRTKYMLRAALGVDFATLTATIRRGSDGLAGRAGPYADGPDIWPSAYVAIPVVEGGSRHPSQRWPSAAAWFLSHVREVIHHITTSRMKEMDVCINRLG